MLNDMQAFWSTFPTAKPPRSMPLDPSLADFHALLQAKGCTSWADVTLDEVDDYWDSTSGAPGPRKSARMIVEAMLRWLVKQDRAPVSVLEPRPKRSLEYLIEGVWAALEAQALELAPRSPSRRSSALYSRFGKAYLCPLVLAAQNTYLPVSGLLSARHATAEASGGAFQVDTNDGPVRLAPSLRDPRDFNYFLKWYLEEREKLGGGSPFLFLNDAGRRPTLDEALADMTQLAAKAGLHLKLSDVTLSDSYTLRAAWTFSFRNNHLLPEMPKRCWRHLENEWSNRP